MLFPFVALFHILWLAWILWDDRFLPFPGIEWLQIVWLSAFTFFWLAVCDLRKWGAMGYCALTLIDIAIHYLAGKNHVRLEYQSNLFMIDGLLCLFLVFYYKKFV